MSLLKNTKQKFFIQFSEEGKEKLHNETTESHNLGIIIDQSQTSMNNYLINFLKYFSNNKKVGKTRQFL